MDVEVEVDFEEYDDNDIFLLCSDGLTDCVSDAIILKILTDTPDLDEASARLVDAANAGGGTDNITVVLAQTLID